MLEYVLFSKILRNRFVAWLQENQIEYQLSDKNDEYLILIDEDIADEIENKIEEQYDCLLDESAKLADAEDDSADAKHLVGIQFTDKSGSVKQVKISPELANKIQQGLNPVELQAFVQQIVNAVYDADDNPLCQS